MWWFVSQDFSVGGSDTGVAVLELQSRARPQAADDPLREPRFQMLGLGYRPPHLVDWMSEMPDKS
jgi:hypothetical protein